MRYLIGGFVLLSILFVALGPWFWILLGAGIVIFVAVMWLDGLDSDVSPEERRARREKELELKHARRMAAMQEASYRRRLEIEAEQRKQMQTSALWSTVGSTAAKVGVGLAVKALTGQSHRHHHRH